MRTLKKYTNGRYYDTDNKVYVTLKQLSQWVDDDIDFQIILSKTGEDITAAVIEKIAPTDQPAEAGASLTDPIKNWVTDQIDKRIGQVLKMLNLPSGDQLSRLSAEIETLSAKIDTLQKKQQAHKKAAQKKARQQPVKSEQTTAQSADEQQPETQKPLPPAPDMP